MKSFIMNKLSISEHLDLTPFTDTERLSFLKLVLALNDKIELTGDTNIDWPMIDKTIKEVARVPIFEVLKKYSPIVNRWRLSPIITAIKKELTKKGFKFKAPQPSPFTTLKKRIKKLMEFFYANNKNQSYKGWEVGEIINKLIPELSDEK